MLWMMIGSPLICLGICLPLFLYYKKYKPFLGACFKALGTVCAFIPALVASLKLNPVYWIFAIALLLDAAADFILEYSFLAGMGTFLLGHLCFSIGFIQLNPISPTHLILLVFFMGGFAFLLWKNHQRIGKNMLPFILYGLSLSILASFGIAGGIKAYTIQGCFILIGSILFPLSDILIFRSLVHPNNTRPDMIIMITYYLSQLLFGLSTLL